MTWLSEMRIILMSGCAFQTQQRAKLALVLTLSHTLDRYCTDDVDDGTNRTLIISPSFSYKSNQNQVRSNSISKSDLYHHVRHPHNAGQVYDSK